MNFKSILIIIVLLLQFGSKGQNSEPPFLKIETINEKYAVGYKSYDAEFDAYSEMWILSSSDTVFIDGVEANSCGIESLSPNGEYAVFSTTRVRWDRYSDQDSMLYFKWSSILIELATVEVLKHCPFDCGISWNDLNQWVNESEIIFDADSHVKYAHKDFFVNAPNGLICRSFPNIDSSRIGKIPFGSVIQVLEPTGVPLTVFDNEEEIKGEWLKVQVSASAYLYSLLEPLEDDQYWREGYIFSGYIENLKRAKIQLTEINEKTFNRYKSREVSSPKNIEKVENFDSIRLALKDQATWIIIDQDILLLDSIKFSNGMRYKINQESNEYSVVAYYPSEQILLFNGGHNSDFSISLRTGECLKTVGNPEYIVDSPNKKLRFNGWFPGQECDAHFFQEKNENGYSYLVDFGWGSEYGDLVCNLSSFEWLSDYKFVYSFIDYSSNSETGAMKYFIGEIIKF